MLEKKQADKEKKILTVYEHYKSHDNSWQALNEMVDAISGQLRLSDNMDLSVDEDE